MNKNLLSIIAAMTMIAANLTAQPAPNAPPDGATNLPITVTVGWRPLSTAVSYEARISPTEDFTEYDEQSVTETSATFGNLFFATTYRWQVRAIDGAGTPTAWSTVNSFTTKSSTGIPELIAPADGMTDLPTSLIVEWEPVDGASGYQVEWSESSEFTPAQSTTSAGPTRSIVNLIEGTQYFWRARVMNAAGPGEWSRYFSFTTAYPTPKPPTMPMLTAPANGSKDLPSTVTLLWTGPSRGVVRYDVELSRSSDFTEIVAAVADLDTVAHTVTDLDAGQTYFWRARSVNDEAQSEWTNPFTFSTAPNPPSGPLAPQLLLPANGAQYIPTTVTVSWDSIADATRYTIEFSHDPEFLPSVRTDVSTSTSYEITELMTDTVYHWRVRAENGVGISAWSRPFTFSTRPTEPEAPGRPILLSPADASDRIEPPTKLEWEPAKNATSYVVQIAPDAGFSEGLQQLTSSTTATLAADLQEATTYHWRVRGVNDQGLSEWSEPWTFTTEAGVSGVDEPFGTLLGARIYPQPATGEVTVEVPFDERSVGRVDLFDLLGNRIGGEALRGDAGGTARITISLRGVAGGVYCCRIQSGARSALRIITVAN